MTKSLPKVPKVSKDHLGERPPVRTVYWDFVSNAALLRVLALATAGLLAVALWMALFYAPREMMMGDAQRIFYFHVPSAWIGFLAFFVVFTASLLFLRTRQRRWDALALASAEIGVVFTTLVLLTGPLWAKVVWGVFWVWDARLTTTLILWLIYVAYLMLRSSAEGERRQRLAAVLGIVGFLDVPLTEVTSGHLSLRLMVAHNAPWLRRYGTWRTRTADDANADGRARIIHSAVRALARRAPPARTSP